MNTRHIKSIYISLIVVLGLAVGLLLFLYKLPYTRVQSSLFSVFPLPIGKVGYSFVYAKNLPQDTTSVGAPIFFDQFQQYADKLRLRDIQRQLHVTPTNDALKDMLAMRIAFIGSKSLNPRYAEAEQLRTQLETGQSFAQLAKLHSDDPATKNFEGDAGFVTVDQMIPELSLALQNTEVGNVYVVPTRDGLEVIRVLEKVVDEKGVPAMHINHILLQDSSFESWLGAARKSARAVLYINLSR